MELTLMKDHNKLTPPSQNNDIFLTQLHICQQYFNFHSRNMTLYFKLLYLATTQPFYFENPRADVSFPPLGSALTPAIQRRAASTAVFRDPSSPSSCFRRSLFCFFSFLLSFFLEQTKKSRLAAATATSTSLRSLPAPASTPRSDAAAGSRCIMPR